MGKIKTFISLVFIIIHGVSNAQNILTGKNSRGAFPLASTEATMIYTDEDDDWLIQKSALLFQQDIEMVTGKKLEIVHNIPTGQDNLVIIGSLHGSKMIRELLRSKKITADLIKNKWEAFQVIVANNPLKGIKKALVITGSDKRGTAYGVFEMSRQIGVSPWFWWADVPVKKSSEIFIKGNTFLHDHPRVRYRGIFINDEAPAFAGWAHEKFGGFNHHVYEKVFELLLRLKANYLWPAMWGNAFNDDDSLNPVLANKYSIVMGTSHHEPMLRAQTEWKRYGKGEWNYLTNEAGLRSFWKNGIENMDSHESIVTIGMRGDGDQPMTTETATTLLERIVADQRKIIEEVTGKPASQTPQLWALYKEVQDYYDKGMRVPDDVTLLLCDDNWGNIRRLPAINAPQRSGGYGVYYHFDYVGDPRNYKWINTNNISRVWEQMHLAYEYGVDRIWIVNVGDLKPMELPISFFLDYAWDPQKWDADNLVDFHRQWAAQQFGNTYANDIAQVLIKYTQFNSRRKPELLSPETYSLTDYFEFQTVIDEYNSILQQAEKINKMLPENYKDALYELVLHPVEASANLNAMYLAAAKNRYYFSQKIATKANLYADSVRYYFEKDSLISFKYNHETAGGKWNHMMDQTHIGYTYWQQPPVNKMPDVFYLKDDQLNNDIVVSQLVDFHDSSKVPAKSNTKKGNNIFYETNGYVSIGAVDFTRKTENFHIKWQVIPFIGRDGDGITPFPVTSASRAFQANTPHLEYDIFVNDTGKVSIHSYFSPTLNIHHNDGLAYAISIDDETPQIISINKDDDQPQAWQQWVADNIVIKTTQHEISKPGAHTLKYWMVDPAVILQKLVFDFGGLKPSYLGPPETKK